MCVWSLSGRVEGYIVEGYILILFLDLMIFVNFWGLSLCSLTYVEIEDWVKIQILSALCIVQNYSRKQVLISI